MISVREIQSRLDCPITAPLPGDRLLPFYTYAEHGLEVVCAKGLQMHVM